eukprot:1140006-Pelagomonas_calceolata.AAC.11
MAPRQTKESWEGERSFTLGSIWPALPRSSLPVFLQDVSSFIYEVTNKNLGVKHGPDLEL